MNSQMKKTVVVLNLSLILASLMVGSFLCVRSVPRLSKSSQELAAKLNHTNSIEKLKELIVSADAYARSTADYAAWLHTALLVASASGLVVGASNLHFVYSRRPSHNKGS